jgi:hypothetical protein
VHDVRQFPDEGRETYTRLVVASADDVPWLAKVPRDAHHSLSIYHSDEVLTEGCSGSVPYDAHHSYSVYRSDDVLTEGPGLQRSSRASISSSSRRRSSWTGGGARSRWSPQGSVALSLQKYSYRVSSWIWYNMDERWWKARMRPNPRSRATSRSLRSSPSTRSAGERPTRTAPWCSMVWSATCLSWPVVIRAHAPRQLYESPAPYII